MVPEDNVPESEAARAREIGRTAFGDHDWQDVLDLVHDSILDRPSGVTDTIRQLRFAGSDLAVEVDVQGATRLRFDVRVVPDQDVTVRMSRIGSDGPQEASWTPELTVQWSKPLLTSFALQWPPPTTRAVRTAWVLI